MKMLTVKEAAELIGKSPRWVQKLINAGRLPAEKKGPIFLIRESDLGLIKDLQVGRPAKKGKAKKK